VVPCTTYHILCLVPVVAHAVLSTPDDGCKEHPKDVERSCSEIKYRLLSAASRWKLIYIRLVMHGTMNVKYFHVHNSSWETGVRSAFHEIPYLLWMLRDIHRFHKTEPLPVPSISLAWFTESDITSWKCGLGVLWTTDESYNTRNRHSGLLSLCYVLSIRAESIEPCKMRAESG
jgi:hypothetical protein